MVALSRTLDRGCIFCILGNANRLAARSRLASRFTLFYMYMGYGPVHLVAGTLRLACKILGFIPTQ